MPAFKEVRPGKEDFNMFESHAIMKYICSVRDLPQHWYPTKATTPEEIELRAKMDIYLDWHHANIRMGAGGYMFRKYFSGLMDKNGVWASTFAVNESWTILKRTLTQITRIWLPKDSAKRYMFGDQPSIADLSLACEIANLTAMKFPLKEEYPTVHKWYYESMMTIPGFKEVTDKGIIPLSKNIPMLEEMLKDVDRDAKPKL